MSSDTLSVAVTEKTMDVLVQLFDRWQDEKDYEDFNEYSKVMEKHVKEIKKLKGCHVHFLKMSKRPFSFTWFSCDDGYTRRTCCTRTKVYTQVVKSESPAHPRCPCDQCADCVNCGWGKIGCDEEETGCGSYQPVNTLPETQR